MVTTKRKYPLLNGVIRAATIEGWMAREERKSWDSNPHSHSQVWGTRIWDAWCTGYDDHWRDNGCVGYRDVPPFS